MTELVKLQDGEPVEWPLAVHYLYHAHRDISFPDPLTISDIAPLGYGFFKRADAPAHNTLIHEVRELKPVLNDGFYVQAWEKVPKYSEEEEVRVLAEHEAMQFVATKAAKLHEANRECDKRITAIVATYPSTEVMTFAKQEAEARNYVTDSAAPTPMIDALSQNRNVAKPELVARIIAKADAFAAYTGAVVGYRQKLEDAINSAETMAALKSIDPLVGWPA